MTEEQNGRYLFGICKVNDKGQIVIPKDARKIFDIKSGDGLILLGDPDQGLALIKAEKFYAFADNILEGKKK